MRHFWFALPFLGCSGEQELDLPQGVHEWPEQHLHYSSDGVRLHSGWRRGEPGSTPAAPGHGCSEQRWAFLLNDSQPSFHHVGMWSSTRVGLQEVSFIGIKSQRTHQRLCLWRSPPMCCWPNSAAALQPVRSWATPPASSDGSQRSRTITEASPPRRYDKMK